jgi:ArsR family metal-binding transcriptional regulator
MVGFMIDVHMAQIVIFPHQSAFQTGMEAIQSAGISAEALEPPDFCLGLAANSILVAGMSRDILSIFENKGISVSGIVPHGAFKRDVPESGAPDPEWRNIVGEFRITSIRKSSTDPTKLDAECVCEKCLDYLIPFMARFIRGGAFNSAGPVLAFEEEQKLVSFWGHRIVICRAEDLLDAWILIRTAIELIIQAWRRKDTISPEEKGRLGIGAIEIFRRLPATNCGLCGHTTCMEFSMALLTGRTRIEKCKPAHEKPEHRKSLEWLLQAIGLAPIASHSK